MIAALQNSATGLPDTNVRLDPRRVAQQERSLQQACTAARVLEDYRGQETLVLDLTAITPIVDYFVITTSTSNRQMRAMADEVNRALKQVGSQRRGFEGGESTTWVLQDYGDIVVHVFTPEGRKLYDLEHLWADAPRIDWKSRVAAAPVPLPESRALPVEPTE